MSELTRRGFVTKSAGTAAGLTAIGGLMAEQADAATDARVSSEPVLAWVKNPRNGEILVMTSDSEHTVRNKKLAAQIARDER